MTLISFRKSFHLPLLGTQAHFADKGPDGQSYGFSSIHVWMGELDHKEGWAPKNWCFWIVVLENTLGLQGDQTSQSYRKLVLNIHWKDWCRSWSSILWPPHAKSRLIWKDPDAGKDWRQEEKGTTEDEIVRWHHWLNGPEFEQTPRDSDRQGSLACCSRWGHRVRHSLVSEKQGTQGCFKSL